MAESIKVIARFRGSEHVGNEWKINKDGKSLHAPCLANPSQTESTFTFDGVLDSTVDQEQMYKQVSKQNVV